MNDLGPTIALIVITVLAWEFPTRKLLAPFFREWAAIMTIYRIRRQNLRLARAMQLEAEKLKGRIVSVGDLRVCGPHHVHLSGEWEIDGSNGAIPHRVDAKGFPYFFGYSAKELIEIHKRRHEFCDRPRA